MMMRLLSPTSLLNRARRLCTDMNSVTDMKPIFLLCRLEWILTVLSFLCVSSVVVLCGIVLIALPVNSMKDSVPQGDLGIASSSWPSEVPSASPNPTANVPFLWPAASPSLNNHSQSLDDTSGSLSSTALGDVPSVSSSPISRSSTWHSDGPTDSDFAHHMMGI